MSEALRKAHTAIYGYVLFLPFFIKFAEELD